MTRPPPPPPLSPQKSNKQNKTKKPNKTKQNKNNKQTKNQKTRRKRDSNPGSSALEAGALTTWPTRQWYSDTQCLAAAAAGACYLSSDGKWQFSVIVGTLLYVFGSCEGHSKFIKEMRLGLEPSGCSMWHFLKLVARGFLRVLRFPPLLHRFNDSTNKTKLK